ncbi:unnamed protein product [Cylindrotheca closterium]|uniref:Uncharacterized protein n=1 Tax=Cylindrotheca closterium TaxID=2856 RepID=A0AAD2JIU0_9STRA|nr:unnamed protein product [Cylindrotheca closterium]
MASNTMWDIFDSFLDKTQERNVCHEMAVKITGDDDIEIVFSLSSDDPSYFEEEVCSVDSYSAEEEPSAHFDQYSEPSNSLLLEEHVEERRAKKRGKKDKYATSLSRTSTTMTTETNSTRTVSNTVSGKTLSTKSVFVDLDEFEQEQVQRDKERKQRRLRRQRRQDNSDEVDDQEDDDHRRNGPLQRKASEETEDSDIDDSLVFDDDFVGSFGDDDEQNNDILVYDADDDLVMQLVDDDDIDDDEALTRLIDIHVGDMMDGSSHMDAISMRLRPTFALPPMPAAPAATVIPILPNHSKSSSKRRNLLSLPQIVEQEVEDEQEGSERQACIEEIEDPHLRTLLKTISRTSKCSENFDMDALMEHFQEDDVQDPSINIALENLSSRIRKANPKSKSLTGGKIEEIDLDLFFDDVRKGVQRESRHDAPTKRKLAVSTENRDSAPSSDLFLDDIVLERGMSSLTMGHKTCISASTVEDSLIVALLNRPLVADGNSENKVSMFSRNRNKKHKIEKNNTREESIQPFSTLNNKGNLSKLKKKLTRNSNKVGKTVGKLLSITPSSINTENSSTFTSTTLDLSSSAYMNDKPFESEDKALKAHNPPRKNRMAQLWHKTKKGATARRGETYQTLDPIGELASA